MKTIGDRIRERRELLGMSQDELAKKLGYKSKSSINKIELNQRDLPQPKIKAIADALDTTPFYIMGWEDNNTSNHINEKKPAIILDDELKKMLDEISSIFIDLSPDNRSKLLELSRLYLDAQSKT